MKKKLLYILSMLLCAISVAQEEPLIIETSNRNLNDDNGFLLVQEISNLWDFQESHWEHRWNTLYTYDENNNLIEELETWTDGSGSKRKRIYLYDDYNKLVEQTHQRWDTSHWTNIVKQNFIYDANNNMIEERHYAWWMDGEWHNADKFIHSYDGSNNRVYTLKQNYWNGSNWENEEQYSFTFDENNNMIEHLWQNWDGSDWLNYWNFIFYYDENSNLTELLWQTWYESNWMKSSRDLFTNDGNNNNTKILTQHWNGSDWDDHYKRTYSFDKNNNMIRRLAQTWFEDDNVAYWLNQLKNTYYYLPAGSTQFVAKNSDIDKPIEDFQTTEDDIVIDPAREDKSLIGVEVLIDSVLHTSDSDLEFTLSHNGISETIIYHVGGDGDNFIGTKLSDYGVDTLANGIAPFYGIYKPENPLSAFLETDPSGTWTLSIYDGVEGNTGTLETWGLVLIYNSASGIEDEVESLQFEIYPNPAVDDFRVRSLEFGVSQATLELFDLNGRKLLEKQIPKGTEVFTVDVSNLQSGLYFCRIRIENKSVMKKLIIKK